MVLKILIIVLLLGLFASLGSGFYFLMKDQGNAKKRRLVHSLGVRVALAISLMVLIVYGVSTGQLRSQAPWEQARSQPAAVAPEQVPPADGQ
jgi:hypothetical protein